VTAGRLAAVTGGLRAPGVYRWPSRAHAAAVRRDLARAGWACCTLDGRPVRDKATLLDACRTALSFPGWFGGNWDALHDCLIDLSWLPGDGVVVLWESAAGLAGNDPDTWRTAMDVFASAATERERIGAPPLFVLVRGTHPGVDLPLL